MARLPDGKRRTGCADQQPTCAYRVMTSNTSGTIEVPASLRSENCSPSARNAVRVPSGISARLRRNPHKERTTWQIQSI